MGEKQTLYYKLVPYFNQIGIKYGNVAEIIRETRKPAINVHDCFNLWLERERLKNRDKRWFRGLEKPEPYSENEDDYATKKDYKYNYKELSERELEKPKENDKRSFTERLQMALLRKGSDNV